MSAGPKEADMTANSNNKTLVSVVAEDIRLVGGQNRFEGRVEVRVNGQWGAVCDDAWETNDAKVVCNALGMGQWVKIFQPADARMHSIKSLNTKCMPSLIILIRA